MAMNSPVANSVQMQVLRLPNRRPSLGAITKAIGAAAIVTNISIMICFVANSQK